MYCFYLTSLPQFYSFEYIRIYAWDLPLSERNSHLLICLSLSNTVFTKQWEETYWGPIESLLYLQLTLVVVKSRR